jgi:hypothetical protein
MTRKRFALLLLLSSTAVLSLTATAAGPALKITFKDVKASNATETDTYAINNAGVIAGDYVDAKGNQHGMILIGRKVTSLEDKNCPEAAGSTAIAMYGINVSNTAVGWCMLAGTGYPIGLLYSKGKLTEFSVPKAVETEGYGINDRGDIVGSFIDGNGAQHGFLLHNKKYTQIDVPSDYNTVAWGINNTGQITVYAINGSNTYEAFVLTGKKYKKISDPNSKGGAGNLVHALNNKGDIDGTYYDSSGNAHGYLYHGGKYYTLNDPKGCKCDTRADGLNDKLDIVGRYSTTLGGSSIGYEAIAK